MNKQRRKQLTQLLDALTETRESLDELHTEEQDAYDNMPEGLQESERGQAISETAGDLENAVNELDSIIDTLTDHTD